MNSELEMRVNLSEQKLVNLSKRYSVGINKPTGRDKRHINVS